MQIAEGLTVFHIMAAVLGILLFLTALALLVRSALKTNTYPKSLITCLVIGGMLEVFPVTGKFEAGSLLADIDKLTDAVKREPGNMENRQKLEEKIMKVENWDFRSPQTSTRIGHARMVMNPGQLQELSLMKNDNTTGTINSGPVMKLRQQPDMHEPIPVKPERVPLRIHAAQTVREKGDSN